MHRKTMKLSLVAAFLFASIGVLAQESTVKGMIVSRAGDTFVVTSSEGKTTVVLTDNTKTKDDRGLLGRDEELSNVVLIPGLKVVVEGTTDDEKRLVAQTITVDGDDLEAAEMIQAGLHPTAEQVAANVGALGAHQQQIQGHNERITAIEKDMGANQQNLEARLKGIEEYTDRFKALADYDVKGQATANFNVGSVTLSAKDRQELKTLAQTAVGLPGYIIEVIGYADSTGSPAMNTKLSEDRAKNVISYLIQQCNVPVRHIVAPGAMGEYGAKATNETKTGRAENRRVEVKILVNKGLAG